MLYDVLDRREREALVWWYGVVLSGSDVGMLVGRLVCLVSDRGRDECLGFVRYGLWFGWRWLWLASEAIAAECFVFVNEAVFVDDRLQDGLEVWYAEWWSSFRPVTAW